MSIEALNAEPPEVSIDDLVSGREYIKRRRFVEILPDSTSNYGSTTGNYRTTFNIGSSGTEFLDSINSYFRCKLTCTTADTANNYNSAYLDIGGIHSFIKSLTIQLRNGTRIEHIDHYNKLYAMKRCSTMSPGQVDSIESYESGDSMAFQPYPDPTYFYSDDRLVSGADANAARLAEATFRTAGANPNAGANDTRHIALREPARRLFANGGQRTTTFKLLSDFLSHYKYLPLPMLQQLQIVIEWERPSLAYVIAKKAFADGSLQNVTDGDTMNYTVAEIRYVANMVEVSDTVLMNYQKAYETTGISLPYITYRAFRNNVSTNAGGATLELQAALNSVRYGLFALMEDECFTESNNAKAYRCQSTFRKAGLSRYAFRSGGYVFPDHGPVDVGANFNSEAFTQLMIALNQHQNTLLDTSMRVWEWNEANTITLNGSAANKTITDATKFIIGVDFTKIDDYSGLDTTGNNIIVELQFSSAANGAGGTASSRNMMCFLAYDSVLNLSKQMGTLIQY